jgi:DNA-directed RNA polymerase beta subunit
MNSLSKSIHNTFVAALEQEDWTGGVEKEASSFKVRDDDVGGGVDTILAATEKILAVNRGITEPDERDSLRFRVLHPMHSLLEERIDLDASNIFRRAMRRITRQKSLKPININHFNGYAENLITGNALSMPLEEINPLHLLEQARRVSQMGPGGLPSDQSITEDAQNLHPSEFGFLSVLEGPESGRIGVDTRLAWNTKLGSDGLIYQRWRNRRTGKYEWLNPADMTDKIIGLPQ